MPVPSKMTSYCAWLGSLIKSGSCNIYVEIGGVSLRVHSLSDKGEYFIVRVVNENSQFSEYMVNKYKRFDLYFQD